LVVSDLHVDVDAGCVVNPIAHYVDFLGKLTNVDKWQYEESDAQCHVEEGHYAWVAPFAATVVAAFAAEEASFHELKNKHYTEKDECNDPNSQGQPKRIGHSFDVSEGH